MGWYMAAMGVMGGFGAPTGDRVTTLAPTLFPTPPMWLMKMMH
jgi:hypothetical protein